MFIIIFHFESIANVAGQTNLKKVGNNGLQKKNQRDPVRISNPGGLIVILDSLYIFSFSLLKKNTFLAHKNMKKALSKVAGAAQMAQIMFPNVAYRVTVYGTGDLNFN